MRSAKFLTIFFVGIFVTLAGRAEITSRPIQQTLDASDLRNFSSYYKNNVSAKCDVPQEYLGSVFKADSLAKYSKCLAQGSQSCSSGDLNAALLTSANKVCDLITQNKQKSSNGTKHVDTVAAKTAAVAKATASSGVAAASSASSSSSSSGTGHIVAGPCDEACYALYGVVRYSWGIPAPFLFGPIDMYPYIGGKDSYYERPQAKCDASRVGQMMAVDFVTEKRAVICMASDVSMTEYVEKLKTANVDSLPVEIAVKMAKYDWQIIEARPPIGEPEIRVCGSLPSCEKATLGQIAGTQPCGVYKCVREDGGPVKSVSDTAVSSREPAATSDK